MQVPEKGQTHIQQINTSFDIVITRLTYSLDFNGKCHQKLGMLHSYLERMLH